MKFKIEYITNTGLKRDHNEDSILLNETIICNENMQNSQLLTFENVESLICCVADGMGGHLKGEVASCFVLKKLKNIQDIQDEDSLIKFFYGIKKELNDFAMQNPEYFNMGSVLAGIHITQKDLYIFNVGDCRVYAINHGYLEQLTQDHSFVYNLYEEGSINYNEISKHPKRNIVTSAFIANNDYKIPQIYIKKLPLQNYQEFFICSDGIWELLDIEELEDYLKQPNKMNLIKDNVLKKGANDNFSGIFIKGLL